MQNNSIKGGSPLLIPGVVSIGLIGLLLFSLFFIFNKATEIQSKIDTFQKNKKDLSFKLNMLQHIDQNVLKLSETVAIAIPPDNPMVFVISQLKKQAQEQNLNITELKMTNEGEKVDETMWKSELNLEIEGSHAAIVGFLNKFRYSLPLIYITSGQIDPSSTDFKAKITLNAYWAPYPEKIAAVSESLVGLTSSEQETLSKLTSYELPLFSDLEPTSPSARIDPFVLQ